MIIINNSCMKKYVFVYIFIKFNVTFICIEYAMYTVIKKNLKFTLTRKCTPIYELMN